MSLLPQVERPSAVSQSAVAALKQLLRRLDDLIARRETLQTELKQIRDHVRVDIFSFWKCSIEY